MAPPERVSFASLAPRTTLPLTAALEGEVVSVRPFSSSARTAALSLAQAAAPGSSAEPLKVQVELRGAWAQHAAEQLAQLNGRGRVRLFAREGECARVELVPVRAGGPAADVPEGRRLKVVFERGIQGRWVVGEPGSAGKGQDFDYRAEARSKHRLKPLAHSLSDDEVVEPPPPARQPTFAERNNLPSRPVAGSSRDKLVVPTGNPHSPWIGGAAPSEASKATAPSSIQSSTRAGQPVASSSRSSSGEPKTKKKRENREVRTTWGLSSSSTNYIYTALDTLPTLGSSGSINIIAMAVVARPTLRVEGGSRDWGCILGLHDPTTATSNFKTEVKYFGKREEDVPVVQDGDIIVIQGLNWKKDNKKLTAYKDKGHYFVLPSARLLDGTKLGNFKPPPCRSASLTDAELSYARDIARWARKHALLDDVLVRQAADSGVAPPNPPAVDAKARSATFARGGGGGRKLVTVEEVCADTFCDIQGEIVKFYKPFGGTVGPHDACSLFITDYTTNDQLYVYSDTSEVRTPGQVTLQVSIFGNQNDPLLSLSEDKLVGRLVHLRNVRPKMTAHDFLEATMVEDPKYENRRDVTLCRSGVDLGREWHEAFKQRRAAYWASLAGGGDGGSVRATGDEKPLTAAAADPLTSLSNTTGLTQQSISSALALKAEGMYRFRARVIDFYPDRLEDWVRAFCPTCGDELSASETTCIDHGQVKHEWSFLLALADEQDGGGGATDGQVPHVFVPVAGDAGDALLPNFTPSLFTSLRFGDSSALSTLASRLRGILGTIVETKRHKKPVLFGHAGPAWDVVLEATKEDDQLRWFFAPGRVAFR